VRIVVNTGDAPLLPQGEIRMMTREEALSFAHHWVAAWNAHDMDRILSHHADDLEMTSPCIVAMMGDSSGTLRGEERVGAYWQRALERFPDLHFEVLDVFVGVNSVAIYYKSVLGLLACEVLTFDSDGKVRMATAHYNRA
jgi:ketosteroid isomerase-like protein